jgi:hypothetical protein
VVADQEGVRIPPRNQNEKGRDANAPRPLNFGCGGSQHASFGVSVDSGGTRPSELRNQARQHPDQAALSGCSRIEALASRCCTLHNHTRRHIHLPGLSSEQFEAARSRIHSDSTESGEPNILTPSVRCSHSEPWRKQIDM